MIGKAGLTDRFLRMATGDTTNSSRAGVITGASSRCYTQVQVAKRKSAALRTRERQAARLPT
jgi:hypothetical protein